ncbi:MAG: AMIN domain-containing protein, partial [Thermodesulfobacteriota bacterium]|nr:AMIN domain-containing protein [Thermodesulfobacteriota bacterium]
MKLTTRDSNQQRMFLLLFLTVSFFFVFACSPKSIQVKSGSDSIEEKKANIIQDLQVSDEADRTRLTVQAANPMTYTVFRPDDNAKIVLDIHDAVFEKQEEVIEVNNGTINKIESRQYDNEAGKVARIEIGLDRIVDYEVIKDAEKLVVYVNRFVRAEASSSDETGMVEDVDFRQIMGKSQIVISTSREAQCNVSRVSEDKLVLELANMDITKELEEGFRFKETDNIVKLIKPYGTIVSGRKVVHVDVELKTMVPYHVFQEKNRTYVEFEKPFEVLSKETPHESMPTPDVKKPKREKVAKAERAKELERKVELEEKKDRELYTGKKISMDFKDADIKNLFRLIAEVSNLNIVAGEGVQGKVTVRMVDVPWDQALDVILATNNLGMTRIRNVITIAPADKIRQQEEAVLA